MDTRRPPVPADWDIYPVEVVAQFTVLGEPVSKARARVYTTRTGATRAYTPEGTVNAETTVGWRFRQACRGWRPDPTGRFGVIAVFHVGNRRPRDIDNMLKLLLDALNKLVWGDDRQVVEVSARVVLSPGAPHTSVTLYRIPVPDEGTPTS